MKATQSFYGNDLAFSQSRNRPLQRRTIGDGRQPAKLSIIFFMPAVIFMTIARRCIKPEDSRSASSTGIRFGVKAAIARVGILRPACLAHGKTVHGRSGTIVGQRPHYRESRPAVRAVYEWITEASVLSTKQLLKTLSASRSIRRHQLAPLSSG